MNDSARTLSANRPRPAQSHACCTGSHARGRAFIALALVVGVGLVFPPTAASSRPAPIATHCGSVRLRNSRRGMRSSSSPEGSTCPSAACWHWSRSCSRE
jgi:threonine dehydratase